MFFYLSAEVLRLGEAIIFENNSRMVCIYPFFTEGKKGCYSTRYSLGIASVMIRESLTNN